MEEALGWYNRVLGLKIEGGYGKFQTFLKVIYALLVVHCISYGLVFVPVLDCNPHLDDIEHLVRELNKTNELFRFVRIVRARFLKAAGLGSSPQCTPLPQSSTSVSLSAPVSSVATDKRSESAIPPSEFLKNSNAGRRVVTKLPIASPASGLPVRRSARLKAKKC
ncbi:hypothetical protein Dimus_004719 [Dionaea muscipula]